MPRKEAGKVKSRAFQHLLDDGAPIGLFGGVRRDETVEPHCGICLRMSGERFECHTQGEVRSAAIALLLATAPFSLPTINTTATHNLVVISQNLLFILRSFLSFGGSVKEGPDEVIGALTAGRCFFTSVSCGVAPLSPSL